MTRRPGKPSEYGVPVSTDRPPQDSGLYPQPDRGSSLRCRRVRNHARRRVSREIRAPVEPDSGRHTRVITWTPWPFTNLSYHQAVPSRAEPRSRGTMGRSSAGVSENGRPRRPSSAPDHPAGSFAAKTSTISILGVSANNRGASAIRVRAMSPARCAWRAASPANASNIANVAAPMRSANQSGVVVSRFASATALSRNPFTSSSLPGFACKRTNSATLTICPRFPEVADMPSHPREGPRAGCTNAPTPGFPPNSGSSDSVQRHFQPPLVQAGSDAAHDHRPGTAKRRTIGSSDVSVSRQFQNAELLGQKTAIALVDCILGPLIEVGVPHRAVIAGDRRNAAKRIVRPMPVQQGSGQALTLRIVATAFRLTVRCDEDPLDGTAGDVVDPDLEFTHARGEGIPLDGRHGRIA